VPRTSSKSSPEPSAFRATTQEDLKRYDADFLLGLYRDMVRTRALDTRIEALYKQGQLVAGCYSSRGQEGLSVGSTAALRKDDVIGPMIRNLGSMLRHGIPMTMVLRNYLGRATGPTKGRDGSSHFGSLAHNVIGPISMLGSLIPVMGGVALSFKVRKQDRVALTWIGDGGSNVGDFHEGLNFAGVLRLPFVLILENNKWAYSTPIEFQTAAADFACRAQGYGIPSAKVEGNDVLAVHDVTREAVERARGGAGPTLIEANTMRMRGHAIHDDAKYVPREMLAEWEKRDPIAGFAARLRTAKILDDAIAKRIDAEVKVEVEEQTQDALAQPPADPAHETIEVYAP
jgi:pyruvate dehydrogenase E1 component alpha subunit